MSIPTLEEKLEWLKPIAATRAEREAAAKVGRGNYEIGVQRTNDILTIRPSQGSEVLQTLIDSHFAPQEWFVRANARHASGTAKRRALVTRTRAASACFPAASSRAARTSSCAEGSPPSVA